MLHGFLVRPLKYFLLHTLSRLSIKCSEPIKIKSTLLDLDYVQSYFFAFPSNYGRGGSGRPRDILPMVVSNSKTDNSGVKYCFVFNLEKQDLLSCRCCSAMRGRSNRCRIGKTLRLMRKSSSTRTKVGQTFFGGQSTSSGLIRLVGLLIDDRRIFFTRGSLCMAGFIHK